MEAERPAPRLSECAVCGKHSGPIYWVGPPYNWLCPEHKHDADLREPRRPRPAWMISDRFVVAAVLILGLTWLALATNAVGIWLDGFKSYGFAEGDRPAIWHPLVTTLIVFAGVILPCVAYGKEWDMPKKNAA